MRFVWNVMVKEFCELVHIAKIMMKHQVSCFSLTV